MKTNFDKGSILNGVSFLHEKRIKKAVLKTEKKLKDKLLIKKLLTEGKG